MAVPPISPQMTVSPMNLAMLAPPVSPAGTYALSIIRFESVVMLPLSAVSHSIIMGPMHPGNSRGLLSVLMGELMQEPAPKKFGKNPNIQIFAGGKKVHETVGPFLQGQDDHRRFEELTFKPSSAQLSVKPASKPLLHQSANGTIQIFKR